MSMGRWSGRVTVGRRSALFIRPLVALNQRLGVRMVMRNDTAVS